MFVSHNNTTGLLFAFCLSQLATRGRFMFVTVKEAVDQIPNDSLIAFLSVCFLDWNNCSFVSTTHCVCYLILLFVYYIYYLTIFIAVNSTLEKHRALSTVLLFLVQIFTWYFLFYAIYYQYHLKYSKLLLYRFIEVSRASEYVIKIFYIKMQT